MGQIVDTGFLYATLDKSDQHHTRVLNFIKEHLDNDDEIVLPTPILVELAYLIATRLGHQAMRDFINSLVHDSYQFEAIQKSDIHRIHEILSQYSDAQLDFVDAFIVALAERLGISTILTVDHRHFTMMRPAHCDHFDVRP